MILTRSGFGNPAEHTLLLWIDKSTGEGKHIALMD
jgi:hypothetical protein